MNKVLAAVALLLMGAADGSTLDRVMGALAERKHGHVSFTEKKFIEQEVATALAINVFPVPGGPYKRTPRKF